MDLSQYRDLFLSESRNHLDAMNNLAILIEQNSGDKASIDEIFRHSHSLKGMAATMQFNEVAKLSHKVEDMFSAVRDGTIYLSADLVDILLQALDMLASMLDNIEACNAEMPVDDSFVSKIDYIIAQKRDVLEKLSEHIGSDKPKDAATHKFRETDSFATLRVKRELLDNLLNITGELVTAKSSLISSLKKSENSSASQSVKQLDKLIRSLQHEVLSARMLPFSFIAERFPRLVRDTARKLGKEVLFSIEGGECEIDRSVLEEIADPIIHILRNAVDHGIESTEERTACGKDPKGKINIRIERKKEALEINISDDGAGIDVEKVLKKAVENGIVTAEDAPLISKDDLLMLVCSPALSTSDEVTDISGRGVGMDAVKTAIHKIGGSLSIFSEKGRYSSFNLILPLNLSIIQVVIVACGAFEMALPLQSVEQSIDVAKEDLIKEGGKLFFLNGEENIPAINLTKIFTGNNPKKKGEFLSALVMKNGDKKTLLLVDTVKKGEEIFVKPLSKPLSAIEWFNGGSITGDGSIIFILDPNSVMRGF